MKAEIGIIGGSGLYSMPGFDAQEEAHIETPFGAPSDNYVMGKLAGRQVAFLARHGRGHRLSPSEVNYRANIFGMKSLGVERIISLSAVGSLKEEHRPLDFVLPDQFFDRTRGRASTFFGEGLVAHISFADPICPELAEIAEAACRAAGVNCKRGGTYLCMEGPAFSTEAESNVYRGWGMDVIGMTNLTEAKLAREAEICYVTVAMVTDYDCWHPQHDAVTVNEILGNLVKNAENACQVVARAVSQMPAGRGCKCGSALSHAILTDRKLVPETTRRRLGILVDKYFSSAIAREALERCVSGRPPDAIPAALVEEPDGKALFGVLVEGLADRFEPALCDAYVRLFAGALAQVLPGMDAAALVARYQRIRRPHPVAREPRRVWVLSRITLGADIAVTSVLLAAAKERFPQAEILFVGPRKNYELFAADPRIGHADVAYPRGSLRHRLGAWQQLKDLLTDGLVIDPDSRLTQLGLLEVCDEERYHFFESRAYGAETSRPLPELAAAWAAENFGVAGARPYVALQAPAPEGRYIAVSLGVGENAAKRLPDPFETELLKLLASTRLPLWLDLGAGGEESERVRHAVEASGAKVNLWDGSFAGFASVIAGSRLYVGYDSAGQHVAAAAGVPLVTIFAGFPVSRMFDRWRPSTPQATVIRVERPEPHAVLEWLAPVVHRLRKRTN